jgi:cyclophilin family peptidyl-prolyl cis-trans isomerase
MKNSYKIICIIAIIICIIICFYLYKKYNKKKELIENKEKIGKQLIPIPKYDFKIDKTKINPYFEIFINDKYEGKIVFDLIDDIAPKTCMNFRYLCSKNFTNNKKPAYQNTIIKYINKDKYISGGHSINYSIFGEHFIDETFELKHNQPGMLAMFNDGPNKNNSKFIITLDKIPEFDNRFVVFGIVSSGYEIIEKINELEVDNNNKPLIKCKIVKSGLQE